MSHEKENPFWKLGKSGKGLPRRPGVEVLDERGGSPRGNHFEPTFPDRDWIGEAQQGGGRVPPGTNWTSSPKENQDRSMGDSTKHLK